ncbi:CHAT domain-containing protein [Leptothoe kymatousa]|uniref:CHAT domain-containing protein n=1 Tax=Leptothoe kymatousa TAU-MAC 1615 TaxID=2364775 RepID=A0ABS5Y8F1_9CYAN|nr:CHAT domain-containing protein [Leptothoe kymatousa]MBT9313649.1 CHAT domain-containing protein [Leptothoe kymatousa TAU-MAC 1615]
MKTQAMNRIVGAFRRALVYQWLKPWVYAGLGMLICGCLVLSHLGTAPSMAQTSARSSAPNLTALELGKQYYDEGQFSAAITQWQQATQGESLGQRAVAHNYLAIGHQALGQWEAAALEIEQAMAQLAAMEPTAGQTQFLRAQVLNTQGSLQLQIGQAEAALDTWKQAEQIYRQQKATQPLVRTQINQAQALRSLGYYRRARQQLEQLNGDLASLEPSWLQVRSQQSLAVILRTVGDLAEAKALLNQAMDTAQSLPANPQTMAELQLSLAKTQAALGENDAATALLQTLSPQANARTQLEASLLQFSLWQQQSQWATLIPALPDLEQRLQAQPPSRWGVYAQVNAANIAIAAAQATDNAAQLTATAQLLAHAVQTAETLADQRAKSYALGQLGHLYEIAERWSEASSLTREALQLAQQTRSLDMAAKWQWQQGRLQVAQGQSDQAILAYTEAVNALEAIQQDLVTMNPEVQFSFREQVEPVYRQLVDLLLTDVDQQPQPQQQQHLVQARNVIESFQLAELQNYFREACLTYQTRPIEKIDPQATIIYPILLDQRLEVIASLPGQPLYHYSQDFPETEQQQFFESIFFKLHPSQRATASLPLAQDLYDWLVRPIENELEQQKITTLVFVPDKFLRSLPMAILHDGKQYLVDKYRISLTPGMQLLNSQPFETMNSLTAFTAGLSEARDIFSALPAVKQELTYIDNLIETDSLLNETFTKANFFDTIHKTSANIVHLATHGQFSSSPDKTFLLAWDQRIGLRELNQLFPSGDQEPIELLVLSACQTASGDDRAALGMAGVAVRSGARTTVATLWSANDEATARLMQTFYRLLTEENLPRAQALQRAQLSLRSDPAYSHPYYWAPFVMVGNWQ